MILCNVSRCPWIQCKLGTFSAVRCYTCMEVAWIFLILFFFLKKWLLSTLIIFLIEEIC